MSAVKMPFGCLIVALVVFSLSCGAHATDDSQPFPGLGHFELPIYEATERYNVLPWDFKIGRLFAFVLHPLKAAPSNPPTYSNYPQLPFQGGVGWLVAIHFTESPIGEYNELFYIPGCGVPLTLALVLAGTALPGVLTLLGLYKPDCSLLPFFSVARIWVDSIASRHAGRSIWGIPKELATFEWRDSNSTKPLEQWSSITLKDDVTGNTIFHANTSNLPMGPGVPLPSWLLPSNIRTVVQWPIDDSNNTFLESAEAFKSTSIAKYTNMKTGEGMRPVLTQLGFEGKDTQVASVTKFMMDPEAFTGDAKAPLGAIPLSVRLNEGSAATLGAPKYIDTC